MNSVASQRTHRYVWRGAARFANDDGPPVQAAFRRWLAIKFSYVSTRTLCLGEKMIASFKLYDTFSLPLLLPLFVTPLSTLVRRNSEGSEPSAVSRTSAHALCALVHWPNSKHVYRFLVFSCSLRAVIP